MTDPAPAVFVKLRPAAQRKTATQRRAAAVDRVVSGQTFLLAMPTRPSRPEPNSQTAAGTDT